MEFTTNKNLLETLKKWGVSDKSIKMLMDCDQSITKEELLSVGRLELMGLLFKSGAKYDDVYAASEDIVSKVKKYNSGELLREEDDVLKRPLYELGFSSSLCAQLQWRGVTTLEEASKYYLSDIRDWAQNREEEIQTMKYLLESNGSSFKKRASAVENQKLIMKRMDVKNMTEEQRSEFFASPIENLGMSNLMLDTLKSNGVRSVEELASLSTTDLRKFSGNNRYFLEGVRNVMARYGVYLDTVNEHIFFTEPKIERKLVNDMTDSERNVFENSKPSLIGMSHRVENLLAENGVETLADVIDADPISLRKMLSAVAYETYKKFVLRLSEFGIEKSYIKARKAGEATAPKVDVETLSDEEREKFFARSIEELGFSEKIIYEMNRANIHTIGDLSKVTRKDLRVVAKSTHYTIQRIEEVMAEYGMKVVPMFTNITKPNIDTFDFYLADDVSKEKFLSASIEELGVHGKFVYDMKTQHGGTTIAHLMSLTQQQLKAMFSQDYHLPYKAINERLAKFGIILPKAETLNKKIITREEFLSADEKMQVELLNHNLDEFDINPYIVKKLYTIGVKTMLDLASTPKPYIREKAKCNSKYMQELEIKLAQFGMKMQGSNCFVVDGKVVSTCEHISKILSEKKVEPVNIFELDEHEREKVLDTRLEDLGLHVRALNMFRDKKGLETIRDLMPLYKSDIKDLLGYNKDYIAKTLGVMSEFGIEFADKPLKQNPELKASKRAERFKKQVEKRDACKTKEEFEALTIGEMGFSGVPARKLKKIGIQTVADLTTSTKKDFIRRCNFDYSLVKTVKQMLTPFGIGFAEDTKIDDSNREIVVPKILSNLSQSQREELEKTPIEELGLSKKTKKIFIAADKVSTLGDIIAMSPIQLNAMLGGDEYLYTKLLESLSGFGVVLPDHKQLRKALKHMRRKTQTESDLEITKPCAVVPSQNTPEERYYRRKMEHLRKYYDYIQARDKKQFAADFDEEIR